MSNLSTYTSVFRANAGYRAKRNRQPVSCTSCQRRKTKCDRQQPCYACWQRGDPDRCRFGTAGGEEASASGSSNGAGNGGVNDGRARGPPVSRQEVHARLTKLEETVRTFAVRTERSQFKRLDAKRDGLPYTDDGGGQGESLRVDRTDGAFHGATSWASLVENIRDIQDILGDWSEDMPPSASELMHQDPPRPPPECFLTNPTTIDVDEILDALPSRRDADKLVATYFNAKFAAYPFIHSHQFRRQYDAFWEDPSSASYLWVSILFSILSIGTAIVQQSSSSRSDSNDAEATEPRTFMILASRCFIAGEYFRAKPLSVEALLAHVLSRNLTRSDSDPSVWTFYGLAMRLAQRQGYHRELTKVSARATPFLAEMRRRTWYMLRSMDLLLSAQQGMPPMADAALCDTRVPSNLLDDDFDEDTVILPPPRSMTDVTPSLAIVVKAPLCDLLDRVLRHALSTESRPYSDVLALHAELEAWHAGVPPCLRIRSIQGTSFTDSGYAIMYRILLEVMYRKTLCILHREYLSSSARANPQYATSRIACKQAAEKLLEIHIELHGEIQPGGRLYEDRYMVNSLTLHDFLIAAMVLCVDLSETIVDYSSSEDRERQISILRSASDIWSARCPVSSEARHATRILQAILRKVDSSPPNVAPQQDMTNIPSSSSAAENSASAAGATATYNAHELQISLDDDDAVVLDPFSDNGNPLDWISIDEYLRNGHPDSPFWGLAGLYGGN